MGELAKLASEMLAPKKAWRVKLERNALSAGSTVVVAATRAEAKRMAKQRHPDCVVTSASVVKD